MVRYSKLISTGQILQTMSGGDDNRPAGMNDENWEALKLTRLNTLKTNAIASGYPESDIAVGWMDASLLDAVHNTQIEARKLSERTPMQVWKDDMKATDKHDPVTGYEGMSREYERHIRDEHGGVAGTPAKQVEYDAKVLLRSNKPL